MKIKQLKAEQLLNQTFSPEKSETKAIKISVLCCLPIEKLNILLECLLPCTHPILYSKCIGRGIQTTVKPNKLSSLITVCRHGFYNGVMAYMLQFGEIATNTIFVRREVFVKATLPCLNLKTDDRFLHYTMPEVFSKTGHGLSY